MVKERRNARAIGVTLESRWEKSRRHVWENVP